MDPPPVPVVESPRPRTRRPTFQPQARLHGTFPTLQLQNTYDFIFPSIHRQPHLFLVPARLGSFEVRIEAEMYAYLGGQHVIFPLRFIAHPKADDMMMNDINNDQTPNISMVQISENQSSPRMVRVLAWNCRGAGRPEFLTEIRQLLNIYRPHMIIVLETRINDDKSVQLTSELHFGGRAISSPVGRAGGLWLLWDVNHLRLRSTSVFPRQITAKVSAIQESKDFQLTALYNLPQFQLQPQEAGKEEAVAGSFSGTSQ